MTTYYMVKYALSNNGRIDQFEADPTTDDDKYVSRPGIYGLQKEGKDCFKDLDQAIAAVEAARKRKIVSLKKQLKKMNDLVPYLDR